MGSNFLYFTYFLGFFGLYYGFLGLSKVSNKVFAAFVYKGIKQLTSYPMGIVKGFLGGLLLGHFQTCQAYAQGALYLGHALWKKAFAFILGAGFSSAIYYLVISQMIRLDLFMPSVVIACLGFLAIFIFRSDLYRVHGQRIFYFGIFMLGLMWVHYIHTLGVTDPKLQGLWLFINEQLLWVFMISTLLTLLLQTSLVSSVLALSLLHLQLISFDASLFVLMGGYVGAPIGALFAFHHVPKQGMALHLVHCALRFFVTGLSIVWVTKLVDASFLGNWQPTHVLILMYLLIQTLLCLIYWPLQTFIYGFVQPWIKQKSMEDPLLHRQFANMPGICFEVAMVQVLAMAAKVKKMMDIMCQPFEEKSRDTIIEIDELYDQIEKSARQINFYLSKMNIEELSYAESQKETHWFQVSHALKNISSFINRNIMEIASHKKERGLTYKEGSWAQVQECHDMLKRNFDMMCVNLSDEDPDKLKSILRNQKQIYSMIEETKQGYLTDLRANKKLSIEAASNYFSLLSQFQFLNISISRLAYPTIDRRKSR